MMSKQFFTLLALVSFIKTELQFFHKIKKPPNCTASVSQLSNLLVLTCKNVGLNSESNLYEDACIGCFQQALTVNNNQPSLANLRDCSENYLSDTRYEECSAQIDTNPGNGACVKGYCRFVTCLRRVNSNLLIAQCYREASVDNNALSEEDQIILIKNITSCILARARCDPINPITGQRQSKSGKPMTNSIPLYNSLQITPEGDLRIIHFPGTTTVQYYFCASDPNLRQSQWLGHCNN